MELVGLSPKWLSASRSRPVKARIRRLWDVVRTSSSTIQSATIGSGIRIGVQPADLSFEIYPDDGIETIAS